MTRVCVVSALYHPSLGGLGRQAQTLTEALARAGVELFVLARRMEGMPEARFDRAVEVIRLPALFPHVHVLESVGPRNLSISLSFSISLAVALVRRRRAYDLVHFHGASVPLMVTLPVLHAMGKKVLAKVAAAGLGTEAGSLRGRWAGGGRVLAALLRSVDGWVAISEQIRAGLVRDGMPAERVHRVDNFVDIERFRPATEAERESLRRSLGVAERQVAVYSGRMVARKGLDDLLTAWRQVRDSRPRALLLLLGEGEERARFEHSARQLGLGESVRFVGHVLDVAPVLRASDLFVLPSHHEGMPNALLEGLASGLPAVATDVSGVREIARDRSWLSIVPVGDAAGLARAIDHAFADPARLAESGSMAAAAVAAEFSLAAVIDRYRELYQALGGTSGTAGRRSDHRPSASI